MLAWKLSSVPCRPMNLAEDLTPARSSKLLSLDGVAFPLGVELADVEDSLRVVKRFKAVEGEHDRTLDFAINT